MRVPIRQIRAVFNDSTVRVYQAYSDAIADAALESGTFVSPPYKMDRMTWIKPSFLWMMYRAGWGEKDFAQKRILAIDIAREGFEWALEHSLLSDDAKNYRDKNEWFAIKKKTPVRIQWDPERDLNLTALDHRSIQIGLANEALSLYVNEWILNLEDITGFATEIHTLVKQDKLGKAKRLLPKERAYRINTKIQQIIGISQ